MRSELVYAAAEKVKNNYLLCHLVAKSARVLHKQETRFAGVINDALLRCSRSNVEFHEEQTQSLL